MLQLASLLLMAYGFNYSPRHTQARLSLSGLLLQAIITPGDIHDTSSNPVDSLELRHLCCEKHSSLSFPFQFSCLVDLFDLGLRKVNNLCGFYSNFLATLGFNSASESLCVCTLLCAPSVFHPALTVTCQLCVSFL